MQKLSEKIVSEIHKFCVMQREATGNLLDPDDRKELEGRITELVHRIEDITLEEEGPKLYAAIERHTKHILGKALTLIDASIPDREQRKAMKDLMRQQFYGELKYACEAYTGAILLSADGEHDPLKTHAITPGRVIMESGPPVVRPIADDSIPFRPEEARRGPCDVAG